jgi:hypothetical protein
LLQHINDFYQTFGHNHSPHNLWYQLNEILKGVGGVVMFLTWYPSRTLNTEFDDIETTISVDTYNQLRSEGYCTESDDEFDTKSKSSGRSGRSGHKQGEKPAVASRESSFSDQLDISDPISNPTSGDMTTRFL